ncbi:DUF3048 domain-containing protein [Candidatus Saccharibacteria bacterium]|nr:DUF3048 domain-containing protein [Candidatus Saccharibacteria bacterium]
MSKMSVEQNEPDIEITDGPMESNNIEKQENHIPSDDEVYDPRMEQKEAFNKLKAPKTAEEIKKSKHKKIAIIVIAIIIVLAGIGAAVYFIFFANKKNDEPAAEAQKEPEKPKFYSKLTGREIANDGENSLPTYCIQIPNGADGARPQTGLDEAGVVFEAIAEAGITRFAAVFQDPQSATIGPIRSLRTYYLDWDTPFDCTVVHAGGSDEAIQALAVGGYRDLTESYDYMWRDTTSYWAPNNLMTSPALLAKFNNDHGYNSSALTSFPRLTPDEADDLVSEAREKAEPQQTDCAEGEEGTDCKATPATPLVTNIAVNFGYVATFNTTYQYDEQSNTYLRSYASGEQHLVYSCADIAKNQPTPRADCGVAKQIAPSAVAVMMVDEYLDTDNYHHVIKTIGTGNAYVFQNGTAVKAIWKKDSKSSQIEFRDADGNVIAFTPGQLWVAAVPNSSGSVQY